MKEDNKHELTEKLKVIETEIHDKRIDLRGIGYKLDAAYKYEDELIQRLESARKKTLELREDFFKKYGEVSELYDKMKNVCDIFTGNFYRH